jgi:hypothetical protein
VECPPKQERLAEFYRRLRAAKPARDFEEAWHQIRNTMDQVEDELTPIPHDPTTRGTDGRMYPPELDAEKSFSQHPSVRRFRSFKQNTLIGANGSIEIRVATENPLEGHVEFSRPGADGKGVMEQ